MDFTRILQSVDEVVCGSLFLKRNLFAWNFQFFAWFHYPEMIDNIVFENLVVRRESMLLLNQLDVSSLSNGNCISKEDSLNRWLCSIELTPIYNESDKFKEGGFKLEVIEHDLEKSPASKKISMRMHWPSSFGPLILYLRKHSK